MKESGHISGEKAINQTN